MGEGGVLSEERGEAEVEVGRGQLHLQPPQVGHRVEGAGLKWEHSAYDSDDNRHINCIVITYNDYI